jgi:multicomponent Na+:H+ antiporter subunit C
MTAALVYSVTGSLLVAIGLYGFVARRNLLRQILAFNVIGSGLFLMFGALARRNEDVISDPVPQAMVITGIVVALSATALAITLALRLNERTGLTELLDAAEEEDG